MKQTVYVESSVISYLTSRPNRDVIIAGRQSVTLDWWENQRHRFELRISVLVEEEISRGDSSAAQQRLDKVTEIQSLLISDEAIRIADMLLAEKKAAITRLIESAGYACPQLCSPEELGGMQDD